MPREGTSKEPSVLGFFGCHRSGHFLEQRMFDVSRKTLLSLRWAIAALAVSASGLLLPASVSAAPPVPGAIFTTTSHDSGATCTGVDLNIYASKLDVYL